ncbi:hypothetical protein KNE206_24020 [Kitasatospora sp. NE20-6]|uniref:DUF4291 family protein n=1 Tax=Kitasatospora sp. NE20-6 TaxID=2859066 RepID=UPI0034DC3B7D
MTELRRIRADYDDRTIVMYQAHAPGAPGHPAEPFAGHRTIWIEPSFRWLMHRTNWARRTGQERVLAVRITREGWERALAEAVPATDDQAAPADAAAHVRWDPERSAAGAALGHHSIQVGVGRPLLGAFVDEWTVSVTDLTPRVHRISGLIRAGLNAQAVRLLPTERPYPLEPALARQLGVGVPHRIPGPRRRGGQGRPTASGTPYRRNP